MLTFSEGLHHHVDQPPHVAPHHPEHHQNKWGGGGSNPIFSQDTPKFGFGDGEKYMKREGNKISIFKIEKFPFLPMMRRNLDLGMEKMGKKVHGKRGKMYSF